MVSRNRDRTVLRGFRAAGLACLAVVALAGGAAARSGYYRTPDIHGDRIVFSAEADLWVAPVAGGEARKLTSSPGAELFPKFSPDGAWIAFAGDYDGNRDVFVVPAGGGEPRRLTWHPAADEPVGWTPDGKNVLFRSYRDHPHYNWEIYRIPAEGGDPARLPIDAAGNLSIDPQSGRWAFTAPGGGGTWKRYRGGTAADIWVGDPARADFTRITSFPGMDATPMWHEGRIFFLCDQGGTVNLWSMNPDGSDRRRLTDLGQWDARFPSMDAGGRIVFGLAGDLHLYDPALGTERALAIDLPSERLLTRTRYPDASRYLTEYALAPEGDRLAVVARGEIFSVPAKDGITLPVTRGSGAREGRVAYDPTGKRMVYVTDASGEETIVTADAWGGGDVKEVAPTGTSTWHFSPLWSPDGDWIAWADQSHALYVVKASGGTPQKVDSAQQGEIREYTFSPDGRWLAYAKMNRLERNSIYIYDTSTQSVHRVTGEYTDDYAPAWDPKGRYLCFLSDRTVNPTIDWLDFETIGLKPTRPYLVLLRPDVKDPFADTKGAPPGKEELAAKGSSSEEPGARKQDKSGKSGKKGDKGDKDDDEDKSEEDDSAGPVEIEFDGLSDRVVEVPVAAGRYSGLAATADHLFYLSNPLRGMAEDEPEDDDEDNSSGGDLMSYDLEKKEAETFLDGVRSFDLQPKEAKIAVSKGQGEIYILDADQDPGDDLDDEKVSLGDVVVELDPREEWRQIFLEAWRGMRDFYWDPGMHGVDWATVRDQYAALLPRISTHGELQDLIGEMIGELSTSHTYVWGGDPGVDVPQRSTGLLGAALSREGSAFKVDRIYRADPADRLRSSLSEPGVNVKEGEYILAVNRQPFRPAEPFEASLENLAGKEVLLTVNSRPEKAGSRDVVVKTLRFGQDHDLLYHDWVRKNREYVAQKTGGKIGYIHLPDMGVRGLKEFDTWFYPQLDKEGMVVDVRWNGGGFVSQLIVSRFMRRLLWWDRARWGGVDTYPYRVLNGPFVVLLNENAGSDGDIFPAAIQQAGLAPIIGKRSWGGVIGIRGGSRPLVDTGVVTNPEFAWWHPEKGWGIENHGVDPDIPVDNLPQDLARGTDAQLDRGIEEVLRRHAEKPPMKPDFGPSPDRSRKAYAGER